MRNRKIVLAFIVLIMGVVGCSSNTSNTPILETQDTQAFEAISTGSTGNGDVSVELTPHALTNGELSVDLSMNTHFVDLGQFDLMEITTLESNGKLYKPLSSPNLGGHHVSGTLIFAVEEAANAFTITIEGIPKIEKREFRWE